MTVSQAIDKKKNIINIRTCRQFPESDGKENKQTKNKQAEVLSARFDLPVVDR